MPGFPALAASGCIEPGAIYALGEFVRRSGLSYSRIRRMAQRGIEIPTFDVGRRKFIEGGAAVAYIKLLASHWTATKEPHWPKPNEVAPAPTIVDESSLPVVPGYLSVAAIARQLDYDVTTVNRWTTHGYDRDCAELLPAELIGGHLYVKKTDLHDYWKAAGKFRKHLRQKQLAETAEGGSNE